MQAGRHPVWGVQGGALDQAWEGAYSGATAVYHFILLFCLPMQLSIMSNYPLFCLRDQLLQALLVCIESELTDTLCRKASVAPFDAFVLARDYQCGRCAIMLPCSAGLLIMHSSLPSVMLMHPAQLSVLLTCHSKGMAVGIGDLLQCTPYTQCSGSPSQLLHGQTRCYSATLPA